jgi:anti-anti-sigma factor
MAEEIRVVRPQGRLDSTTSPGLEKALLEHIEGGDRRLLLDLADLGYISSMGLRVVLLAAKRMRAAGGKFALCSLNANISEVFEISGFSSILDIFPTHDAATAALAAP